ncbi:hypothetical protein E8E14_002885 [Neopestalotiopsis sp. 37M]|nr:hypothetical protein E8E14_002885 [Neopestalotiopsis sp. 37M]
MSVRRGQKRAKSYQNYVFKAKDLKLYQEFYFKLQNLEQNRDILPQARQLLLKMLTRSLAYAKSTTVDGNILAIETYNRILDQWELYLQRRNSGHGIELFDSRESAQKWLRGIAPVKYVDGAWLGHMHRVTTPFALRAITKNAWQILSEELGDGDLQKNHVYLFKHLLQTFDEKLPASDTAEFLDANEGTDDINTWKAAVAQLLISLFPNDFLPEILGFNLHYEMLTLETLKAAKELPRFGLSAYYFHIHVSIDNADSGHTAMALGIVTAYLDHVRASQGEVVMQEAWKRIQAGYLLSKVVGADDIVPNTVSSLNRQLTDKEVRLLDIFRLKAGASHRIHCASQVKIGQRTLVEWLSPAIWASKQWQLDFLDSLNKARPWVQRGNSSKSLLIRELSWNGRMFGAFTDAEVKLVADWIDSLSTLEDEVQPSYWSSLGLANNYVPAAFTSQDIAVQHPVFPTPPESPDAYMEFRDKCSSSGISTEPTSKEFHPWSPLSCPDVASVPTSDFLALWLTHACLLENTIITPFRTTECIRQHIIRILRANYGFMLEADIVAGMDESKVVSSLGIVELGVQLVRRGPQSDAASLKDILGDEAKATVHVKFAYSMLRWSMEPEKNRGLLLGLERAFLDLEEWASSTEGLFTETERQALKIIVTRKMGLLDLCLQELKQDGKHFSGFLQGYRIGRTAIERLLGTKE